MHNNLNLTSFMYNNIGSVRLFLDGNGQTWFCLLDVCNILGIVNNRNITSRLFPDGVHTMDVIDSLGRTQNMTFIDEGNLFKTIISSRKPEAQDFQRWVCYEVLPMIRRTGAYFSDTTLEQLQNDPAFFNILIDNYVEIRKQNEEQKKRIEFLEPIANKYTTWLHSDNVYNVREASFIIGIRGMGLINLFKYFRHRGYVDKNNIAYMEYQNRGWFKVEHKMTILKNGRRYNRFQTFLTPIGIEYFRERLISEGYVAIDFSGVPEAMESNDIPDIA